MKLGLIIFFVFYYLSSILSRSLFNSKPQDTPSCNTDVECEDDCSCEHVDSCSLLAMNESDRNKMLFYHNQIRSLQTNNSPEPAGLVELVYDKELENISECWAARCSSDYSSCFYTSKFSDTSQSVVQIILDVGQEPTVLLWMQMNKVWQMQAKSISPETFSSLPEGKELIIIHNFAQIVSDNIHSVGCAWSLMERLITFACTYGPRGPKENEAIYKIGQPCSFCPDQYKCEKTNSFPRLCKTSEKIVITSVPPSHTAKPSKPPSRDNRIRKEKIDLLASENQIQHSLPLPPPTRVPCGLECTNIYFSKAQASTYQTSQTQNFLDLKRIQDYLRQLPLIHPLLPTEMFKEVTDVITKTTSVTPQPSSFVEYQTEVSISNLKVDVNINLSFPIQIFSMPETTQATEAYQTVKMGHSVSLIDPEDPDEYELMLTSTTTVKPWSFHFRREKSRVVPLTTLATTDSVADGFLPDDNFKDNQKIWRNIDTSNSFPAETPRSNNRENRAPIFLALGIGVLFLILGGFLVVLLIYILRIEANV